ncbi:MAG: class I SAM-dependent methyltransferase [Candidatus Acidiferrales bacterium]
MQITETRKILEAEFHDKLRDPSLRDDPELYARLTSNKKWYSVNRKSSEFLQKYLREHSPGAYALDYACGDGALSFLMAEAGARVVGIDISEVSVRIAREEAKRRSLRATFHVMDCESLDFPAGTFDLISVAGVLHHLDVHRAYPELARVLKPSGKVFCMEALAHNPVFHAYRKLTPHLRTTFETEHILRRRDVQEAKKYFHRVECRFFHLASLAAAPLRNTRLFDPVLSALEKVDEALLSVPPIQWWAWQVGFVLSEPRT